MSNASDTHTVLITGANRGIGLALAQLWSKRPGCQVIATFRQSSDGLSALGCRVEEGVEMDDPASLQALAQRLEGVQLHTVILNAGILQRTPFGELDAEPILRQFRINAVAPVLLSQYLRPNMAEGCKLALITSRMGSIGDNGSGGAYGYRMSKAALNIAGVSLAQDLRDAGIAVALLHPGMVATDMIGKGPGRVSPEDAAEGLTARIDVLTLATSGQFWHAKGEILPW